MALLRTSLLLGLLALPAGDPVKTSFSVLAGFQYQEGMTLPKEVTDLDEKTVTVSGFMQREVPGSNPVEQFLIVNDACGCNGTPMLHEIVFCTLPAGQTSEILPGIVTVTGKFYVGEVKEEGTVVMLYQMDVDVLK
ncbi:MAG: hypothetical protein FJ265_17320 [Planctomycetes bacterium]|nr:hypothetical protein [Planctomycetota bacterium]